MLPSGALTKHVSVARDSLQAVLFVDANVEDIEPSWWEADSWGP